MQAFHYAYEAYDVQQSLHPDKRRHGARLEKLPQTAITAPLAPLSIKNAMTKPVNVTQACSVTDSQEGIKINNVKTFFNLSAKYFASGISTVRLGILIHHTHNGNRTASNWLQIYFVSMNNIIINPNAKIGIIEKCPK